MEVVDAVDNKGITLTGICTILCESIIFTEIINLYLMEERQMKMRYCKKCLQPDTRPGIVFRGGYVAHVFMKKRKRV